MNADFAAMELFALFAETEIPDWMSVEAALGRDAQALFVVNQIFRETI
jgi:hypothetical protein